MGNSMGSRSERVDRTGQQVTLSELRRDKTEHLMLPRVAANTVGLIFAVTAVLFVFQYQNG